MRRWPPQEPPPCDQAHRSGGRRPPALGRGACCGADVGGPGRWRCAPIRPRSFRRVLPGRDHGAGLPRRRHLREGGRRRPELRVARVAPARSGGLGALPPAPEFPRLLDVYDDGDWVALAFVAIDGRPPTHPWDPTELQAAVRALDALHDALTPTPVADAPAAAERLQPALRRLGRAGGIGRPPEGLDDWSARHLGPPGRARVGLARRDGRVRRCSTATCAPTTCSSPAPASCSSTGRTPVSAHRSSTWSPGRPPWSWRAGPPPKTCSPFRSTGSAIDRDAVAPLVAAFGGFLVCHSLQPPPPGLPTLRAVPGRAGCGGAGLGPAPHGLVSARRAAAGAR